MGKLLLKLASAAMVPVVLWYVYILSFPMYYLDIEYPGWIQQKDYVNKNSDYNEILVFGDSSAKCSICTDCDDNLGIYNLALAGSISAESYVSLRNYLKAHEKPETVIVMFAALTLVSQLSFFDRTLYFNFYSMPELIEMYNKGQELNDPFWASNGIESEILKYYLKYPDYYLAAVNNSNLFDRYDENMERYMQLEQSKGWISYGTADGNYDDDFIATLQEFKVGTIEDFYIRKIIELCEENGIEIIIEQPPIKESSISVISESVVSEFEGYFRQLQKDYPYAIINTSLVYYENEYFGDVHHLNREGAERFTAELIDKYFRQ